MNEHTFVCTRLQRGVRSTVNQEIKISRRLDVFLNGRWSASCWRMIRVIQSAAAFQLYKQKAAILQVSENTESSVWYHAISFLVTRTLREPSAARPSEDFCFGSCQHVPEELWRTQNDIFLELRYSSTVTSWKERKKFSRDAIVYKSQVSTGRSRSYVFDVSQQDIDSIQKFGKL